MTPVCTRCGRDAVKRIYGTARNGHLVTDYRCNAHAPIPEEKGTWLLKFRTARPFGAVEYRYTGSGPIEQPA